MSHHPYPYQERVLEALMDGKNVILVIPTGGGKTEASCVPFVQNWAYHDGLLPEKAAYMVPTRVLATQFQKTCKKLLDELSPAIIQQMEGRYRPLGRPLVSLQTGETPDDPQFESPITSCTTWPLRRWTHGPPPASQRPVLGTPCGQWPLRSCTMSVPRLRAV